MVVRFALWALSIVAWLAATIVIVLGLAPDLEAALYATIVALILFWSAVSLLWLVYAGRRPASA